MMPASPRQLPSALTMFANSNGSHSAHDPSANARDRLNALKELLNLDAHPGAPSVAQSSSAPAWTATATPGPSMRPRTQRPSTHPPKTTPPAEATTLTAGEQAVGFPGLGRCDQRQVAVAVPPNSDSYAF